MKLIIITGQTATGKTKLALELAKKYNGELINCDSRQIYKKLNIITGKDLEKSSKFKVKSSALNFDIGYYKLPVPTGSNRFQPISTDSNRLQPILTDFNQFQLIPTDFNRFQLISTKIWLYDIVDPKQYFSSFDWKNCAQIVIEDIKRRGKTPIIVGGTYLYIKHLLYGVETENIPPNWQLRKKLKNKSVRQLQEILKKISPHLFNQLNQSDKNNPRRLIRKLEIANHLKSTNQINSSYLPNLSNFKEIPWQIIGLKFKNKDKLNQAIKNRVEKRLKNGAIEEVETLIKKGYSENDPGLKTIGYQQIIAYLKGKLTEKELIQQWTTAEIQYAKRQYTFMKKDPNIKWIEI